MVKNKEFAVVYRKSDLIWKDEGDASVVCGIIEFDKLEFRRGS